VPPERAPETSGEGA
jgi:hypothetical protein